MPDFAAADCRAMPTPHLAITIILKICHYLRCHASRRRYHIFFFFRLLPFRRYPPDATPRDFAINAAVTVTDAMRCYYA